MGKRGERRKVKESGWKRRGGMRGKVSTKVPAREEQDRTRKG